MHQYSFLHSEHPNSSHFLLIKDCLFLHKGVLLYEVVDSLELILEYLIVQVSEHLFPFGVLQNLNASANLLLRFYFVLQRYNRHRPIQIESDERKLAFGVKEGKHAFFNLDKMFDRNRL